MAPLVIGAEADCHFVNLCNRISKIMAEFQRNLCSLLDLAAMVKTDGGAAPHHMLI